MGWFSVLICVITVVLMYAKAHTILMIIAIIAAIGCFWSWGVMHNFATKSAKKRSSYQGGFYDFTLKEVQAVPDWIAQLNMGFSLLGVILLIIGIIIR